MIKHRKYLWRAITLFILALLIAGIFFWTQASVAHITQKQARLSIKEAVIAAAVQCFAIEGAFPSSLSYLEKNYNLRYNHDAYIVSYECFASNIMPEVEVHRHES